MILGQFRFRNECPKSEDRAEHVAEVVTNDAEKLVPSGHGSISLSTFCG